MAGEEYSQISFHMVRCVVAMINEDIIKKINSIVGEFKIIKDHRKGSNRTGVLEIRVDDKKMFVKLHNRLSRWSPEVYAYRNWTHKLKEYAPELIHYFCHNDIYGIIITPIEGRTVNEYQINDENMLKIIYFKAGELLKTLHTNFQGTYFGIPDIDGLPLDRNIITDPVDYINISLENMFKSGYDKGVLYDNDKRLVQWCLNNSYVFKDSKPVPTNWDFSQNNWMVDTQGNFKGIIDFENMLWGIDLDSFGIVIERYTQNKPSLRKSIFEGYGLEDSIERQMQLRIISIKRAIADITYGSNTRDDRLISLGRSLINSLV